ncbi:MAG: thiamine diphosphokinase [Ktedonobacteraceae bacterium]
MHVIIFAGGTVQQGTALNRVLREGELVIAADSGARAALALGKVPALVVGDFDSLDEETRAELERLGCQFVVEQVEKDETDTELAIEVALQQGASRVTILGALGGTRFEHTIANILLLTGHPTLPIELVDGNSRGWLLHGPGTTLITGKKGDLLSLFPLTASATGVRTENLYYPLHDEALLFGKPRGISNVLLGAQARVALDEGLLLLVHTAV